MISSSQDLAQFSSVVLEHCNAFLWLNTGFAERIEKRSVVEAVIARLMGFNNLSECQHQLKKGFEIKFVELLANGTPESIRTVLETPKLNKKVSDWVDSGEMIFVSNLLSQCLYQAAACYQRPGAVTLSDSLADKFPSFFESESSYEHDRDVAVNLSLIDHKLYPYSAVGFEDTQCITLYIPNRSYVDNVIKKLNSEYSQHHLARLHEHMPIVSFSQEDRCLDFSYHRGAFIFEGINNYSERVNAFVYHQMLLQCLLNSASDKVTKVCCDEIFTWQSAVYLVTNSNSPVDKLKTDLPEGVVTDWDSNEDIHYWVSEWLTGELRKLLYKTWPTTLTLPQDLFSYFEGYITNFNGRKEEGSVIQKAENRYVFQAYPHTSPVEICFIKPEFRIWVHYNQQHSHKVDRLTDAAYESRDVATRAAVELLCQYQHLKPDWDRLTTKEFSLKVIDVSHHLNLDIYSLFEDMVAGKDTSECVCWPLSEPDTIVDCECREPKFRRMKNRLCNEHVALVAGSGLSTTRLRTPLLFSQ